MYKNTHTSICFQTQGPINNLWMLGIIAQRSIFQRLQHVLYLFWMAPGHLSRPCSYCLQASFPGPDQRVCRQTFVASPVYCTCTIAAQRLLCLRCSRIPFGLHPPCLVKYACRWHFCCTIRKLVSLILLNLRVWILHWQKNRISILKCVLLINVWKTAASST